MGSEDNAELPLTDRREHLDSVVVQLPDTNAPVFSIDRPPHPKKSGSSRSFTRILTSHLRRDNEQSSANKMKRTISSAKGGLKGLRFIDKAGGKEGEGWKAMEKKFDQFAVEGRLPKEEFGRCIGEFLPCCFPLMHQIVGKRLCLFAWKRRKRRKNALIKNIKFTETLQGQENKVVVPCSSCILVYFLGYQTHATTIIIASYELHHITQTTEPNSGAWGILQLSQSIITCILHMPYTTDTNREGYIWKRKFGEVSLTKLQVDLILL